MEWGKAKKLQVAVVFSVAALSATGAYSQTPNTGATGALTFTSRFSAESNPGLEAVSPGTVLDFSEGVGVTFRTETSAQFLEFTAATDLSFSNTVGGGTSTSIGSPTAALEYFRESADANIDVTASFFSGDVSSAFDIDPTDATFIIVDTGTVAVFTAAAEFNWAQNSPLSYSAGASVDRRNYEGTTDPSLVDITVLTVQGSAGIRISPTTQGTLSVGYRDETIDTIGPLAEESGVFGEFELVQTMPNGSLFGSIEIDQSGADNTTALTIGRSLDFTGSTLTASASAERSDVSGVQFIGSASYSTEFQDGSFSVDVSQELSTNTLGEDIKLSTVGIAYGKTLNSSSGLALAFDLSRSEDGGAGAAATLNRASLTATYSRTLTPDWDLSVGYSRSQNSGSAVASASSDSVFLTLVRDIQFGF